MFRKLKSLLARRGGGGPKAFLVDKGGSTDTKIHTLRAKPTMLGRAPKADQSEFECVTVRVESVGRQHAVIEYHDDTWRVRDQGSRNGTFVNGEKVEQKNLQHGDLINLHRTEFKFLLTMTEERDLSDETSGGFSSPPEPSAGPGLVIDTGPIAGPGPATAEPLDESGEHFSERSLALAPLDAPLVVQGDAAGQPSEAGATPPQEEVLPGLTVGYVEDYVPEKEKEGAEGEASEQTPVPEAASADSAGESLADAKDVGDVGGAEEEASEQTPVPEELSAASAGEGDAGVEVGDIDLATLEFDDIFDPSSTSGGKADPENSRGSSS